MRGIVGITVVEIATVTVTATMKTVIAVIKDAAVEIVTISVMTVILDIKNVAVENERTASPNGRGDDSLIVEIAVIENITTMDVVVTQKAEVAAVAARSGRRHHDRRARRGRERQRR